MSSLQMNPCSKPIPIAHSEGPASETRKVFLTYIDRCVKNPLEVKVCVEGGGGGGAIS